MAKNVVITGNANMKLVNCPKAGNRLTWANRTKKDEWRCTKCGETH